VERATLLCLRCSSWRHTVLGERARRHGKSYLLQALATALGGMYFPALEVTEAVSLRCSPTSSSASADRRSRRSGLVTAIALPVSGLSGTVAVPVVIDEFPFLVKAIRAAGNHPSELGPGGGADHRAGTLFSAAPPCH